MNAIIFSAVFGILCMFSGAYAAKPSVPKMLAIFGISVLLIVNGLELYTGRPLIDFNATQQFRFTNSNLIFLEVLFAATLFYFLLNGKDIARVGREVGEYYALIFFILCGATICCTFNTLLMLFLGIEIMSIPQYILTGSEKRNLKGNEAALKYFLMGSFSTGILLMGVAFIYGGNPQGTFYIQNMTPMAGVLPVMMVVGLVFILVALAFKVSAAPFHFWTPDVYDGAPTVFTGFMSTVVKVAGFYAFLRLFMNAFGLMLHQWQILLVLMIILTLLAGNITAVFQQSVKRMMAYSSIAQAGFMLFAVFAINDKAQEGLLIYAAAYCLASIGFFSILSKMNDYTIEGFNGLGKTHPGIALCAAIFLLSLTGIPLTAGFQAKFYMLMAAADYPKFMWLLIIAVLFAAVSAYYYFRVIQAMYFKSPVEEDNIEPGYLSGGYKTVLYIVAAIIIILGIYPDLLIDWMYWKPR